MPTKPFNATKSIDSFMHCSRCLREKLPQRLEVGFTVHGLQVWCKNHEMNVMHIDFEGAKHPAIVSAHDPDTVVQPLFGNPAHRTGAVEDAARSVSSTFLEATEHPYTCKCDKCLDWWVDAGPDGYDNFGPFAWQAVRDRAAFRKVPFTRGVKEDV